MPSIGPNICDNIGFLRTLSKTKSETRRRRLLKKATSSELLAIVEICLNIIKSRFRLTTRQKKRILPYAGIVRSISRIRSERGARKILQRGGGFPIAAAAAILTPIIIDVVRNL
jgi:hypothetical protein